MSTVAELKEKLAPYKVSTNGLLKQDLIDLLERISKTKEKHYETPSDLTPTPIRIEPVSMGRALSQLRKRGWAVVKVPGWDSNYVNQFESVIESNFPFKFSDSSTWMTKNLPFNLHGIFKYDLGHTAFHWELRELCYPIFATLFDEEDLLCSFDSLNLSYSRKRGGDQGSWFHVDTTWKTKDIQCYQGVINFLPNGPDDGGLIVVDKSHLILDDYLERHPSQGLGFWHPEMGDPAIKDLEILKICLEPGQIALWDSRTIHCNCQPTSENLRMACYVSMQPRHYATESQLERRIQAFEAGKLTGHWIGGPLFGINSNRYSQQSLHADPSFNLKKKDLCLFQQRLVGYEVN